MVWWPRERKARRAEALGGSGVKPDGRVPAMAARGLFESKPRAAFTYNALRAAAELEFSPVKSRGEVTYLKMMVPFYFSEKRSQIVELPSPPSGGGGRKGA